MQKIVLSIIGTLLLAGGAIYGTMQFISMREEAARIEAEKRQLDAFDYINFNTDADSISKALNKLPGQFNSPQPPSFEWVKQTVGDFFANKKETTRETQHGREYTFYNAEKVTLYTLKEIQILQYDYVKGEGGNLVCFVNYKAVIGVIDRKDDYIQYTTPETHGQPVTEKSKTPRDNEIAQSTVKETARYDFVNGTWSFRQAGLSELNGKLQMDKVRIEARNNLKKN